MGLWLLSESIRTWEQSAGAADPELSLAGLLAAAAEVPRHLATTFDVDDPAFLAPGDMPARIVEHCRTHDLRPPTTRRGDRAQHPREPGGRVRAHPSPGRVSCRSTAIDRVHIVGGGSLNTLLCQLTADRTGLPVLAGPVEATALGNVLIQARSAGLAPGSLESLRALVARTHPPLTYQPRVGAVERD